MVTLFQRCIFIYIPFHSTKPPLGPLEAGAPEHGFAYCKRVLVGMLSSFHAAIFYISIFLCMYIWYFTEKTSFVNKWYTCTFMHQTRQLLYI